MSEVTGLHVLALVVCARAKLVKVNYLCWSNCPAYHLRAWISVDYSKHSNGSQID
jgi:hypothetical protein